MYFRRKPFRKLESGLESLPQDVYLSFDLDVMDYSLMKTGYPQGSLRHKELMKCIEMIKQSKHIIGSDVLGYAGQTGNEPGKQVYKAIVASLMQV